MIHNSVNRPILDFTGNLVHQKTEAIVDPASEDLDLTVGAARAIAVAVGPRLEDECRDFISQHGQLEITQAMHTSAGNLPPPISYVIHVVGPSFTTLSGKAKFYQDLRSAFRNCLQYANDVVKVRSVSVPGISTGRFTEEVDY